MPTLSIVIASLAGTNPLERGLVTVLANRPTDCEVVVAHSHAYDDPYELGDEVRFIPVPSDCGLVECFHHGLRQTSAPVVHCLQAGLEVTEGWCDSALAHFDDPLIAAVAPEVVETELCEFPHMLAAVSGSCQSSSSAVASPGSAKTIPGPDVRAAFYRRDVIERLRVPAPNLGDYLADVDFALALRQTGLRAVLEPNSRIYFACDKRRSFQEKPSPSPFRRGLYAERLFWRNFRNPQWSQPLRNHIRVVSEAYRTAPSTKAGLRHILGRLLASCQVGHYWQHHRRLRHLSRLAAVSLSSAPLAHMADENPTPLHPEPQPSGGLRRAG